MLDLMRAVGPEVTARRLLGSSLPDGRRGGAQALHQVRIEAKKLRYVLEILTPSFGPAGKKLVPRLKRLQDRIGDFHDDVVLDDVLAEARTRAVARERPRLAGEIGRLRAARRRGLLADERACRRDSRRSGRGLRRRRRGGAPPMETPARRARTATAAKRRMPRGSQPARTGPRRVQARALPATATATRATNRMAPSPGGIS
jgi:hypothetical protein